MEKNILYKAIIGDICGSIYERRGNRIKYKPESLINSECRFTDDTVHTIAIANALMLGSKYNHKDFTNCIKDWSKVYPHAGYGGMMIKWINSDNINPYNSFGNGSAMRVSACGWVDNSEVVAKMSSEVTHNHPEGIKGAVLVAKCISSVRDAYLDENFNISLDEYRKNLVRDLLTESYPDYDLSKTLDDRRLLYRFDSTCQGSVPQSIQCVLEANDYEDAIKLAISMGGDSDTMACIAGSIAGVIWEVPQYLIDWVNKILPTDIKCLSNTFDNFINKRLYYGKI